MILRDPILMIPRFFCDFCIDFASSIIYDLHNLDEDYDRINLILSKRKPAVLRGLNIGSCQAKWTCAYLQEKLHGYAAAIHVTNAACMNFIHKNFQYETLNLGELVHRLFSGEPLSQYFQSETEGYYLRTLANDSRTEASNFSTQFPNLADDLRIPNVFDKEKFFSSVLRMSSGNLRLWNHYDVMDNILIEIIGSKEITFFSPYDARFLYLQGDKSLIQDPTNYDKKEYPLMQRATPIMVTVQPGDVIFIPALWFHSVKSLEASLAVNVFWYNLAQELYDSKDVYGNRDPLPVTRAGQSIATACKHMKTLPAEFQHLYALKLIEKLQQSLCSSDSL